MTLKELRISKGLNQRECAEFLDMSLRSYQNYENIPEKTATFQYSVIYRQLESYGRNFKVSEANNNFYTEIITGADLCLLTRSVAKFQKRECFQMLQQYAQSDASGKIAILYGLRRTGKTTLLLQMIRQLPPQKTAYIKISVTDNMSRLMQDLEQLRQKGVKYVFIDEITLLGDFISTAATLSDIFAMLGMKIVLSGTDSLGFAMANADELYDRNVMIHTSFIPFREYSRLLGVQSIDTYIEYGGTLKMENMGFDDPDSKYDDVSFRNDESTRKYIDTAISRNIQHTLKNDSSGEGFNQLRELYSKGELTNVINRIIESMNHQFLISIVEENFKSHDMGSARQMLLHEHPSGAAHVLYDVDEGAIIKRLKALIDVKDKFETTIDVTQNHIDKIKKYLSMLDLLIDCNEEFETGGRGQYTVFTQPGMRYAITKALVYSLMQDDYFSTCSASDRAHITEKIFEDVKGRMMEDIILLETAKTSSDSEDIFKFVFDDGGEYGMVVYDGRSNTCRLYEVKHSDKIADRQTRYLLDDAKLDLISHRFGNIAGRYVIYRGKAQLVGDIQYLNAEEYLNNLG